MKRIIRFLRKLLTSINPILSNRIMYHHLTGKKLNFKNPITFNDKINWLKFYQYPNNETVIKCTDKYLVREYLKKKQMDKYIVKLIDKWDKVSDIDWGILPNKYVLKCNHGSKYNIICDDKSKLDIKKAEKKLKHWMNEDFGKTSCEPHYSKIKRKIICEEYLGDNLVDLQVWCSYGKILFIVYINSPHGVNEKKTFDENWNELDFVTSLPKIKGKQKKPKRLEEVICISKKLSKEFVFLRMDFYILKNGDIKISEMSFSPASGFIKWNPSSADIELGKKLNIEKYLEKEQIKKNKLCIIGRVADDKELYDGQTVLTRMLRDNLKKQLPNCRINLVDTYEYKKHMISCFFKTLKNLFTCQSFIILLSVNGLSFYLPFLHYLNKLFKRNIYHRVIGGSLDKQVIKHPKWKKYLNSLNYNYVESQSLVNKLNELGIKNAKVSPNFKNIEILDEKDIKKYNNNDEIRFCTFSRVIKEKGISDAIDAIISYNKDTEKKVYLDIYGPVANEYKEEFELKVKKSKYVTYKGVVSSDKSVEILKKYFMLLFPTYWEGEGFPGTLIDAFSSGLPTIATDWNYNSEIIEDGVTGLIYDNSNKASLIEMISYSINNKKNINDMRFNCLKEAERYKPGIVVGGIVKDIKNGCN